VTLEPQPSHTGTTEMIKKQARVAPRLETLPQEASAFALLVLQNARLQHMDKILQYGTRWDGPSIPEFSSMSPRPRHRPPPSGTYPLDTNPNVLAGRSGARAGSARLSYLVIRVSRQHKSTNNAPFHMRNEPLRHAQRNIDYVAGRQGLCNLLVCFSRGPSRHHLSAGRPFKAV